MPVDRPTPRFSGRRLRAAAERVILGALRMKRSHSWRVGVSITVASYLFLSSSWARADIGIPVGAIFWPASWLLLLPVVVIEAVVARRVLKRDFATSVKISLKANAWSTGAGVPVVCLVMFFVGLVFGSGPGRVGWSPWLADLFLGTAVWLEGLPNWALFAGPALICVPCYFVSVRIETWSAAKTVPVADARRWARSANRITYGVLVVVLTAAAICTGTGRKAPGHALNVTVAGAAAG